MNSAQRLIQYPEERARVGAAGLRLYQQKFDWPLVVAALTDAANYQPAAHI
jgi:hypothetical protein